MNTNEENTWQQRYLEKDTPWDRGEVNPNIRDFISRIAFPGAEVIEVGCGTGTHSVWMASCGLQVTGIDIAPFAIEKARKRANDAGVSCNFIAGDFFQAGVEESRYDAALDLGCFHVFDEPRQRLEFARKLSRLLKPGALWLTLVANADVPPRESGPPVRSAADIVYAVEPWFEILSLQVNPYESMPYKFWVACMQNRQPS
jgi:2-polyprenyl-3-methyl-5-hydroxy-6-metoxy-1,4-benzoquinol methylase